jgi:serine O-acetyltransferase
MMNLEKLNKWAEDVFELIGDNEYLMQDISRWPVAVNNVLLSPAEKFTALWLKRQEFRSLIRYRINVLNNATITKPFKKICHDISWCFVNNLYISCPEIGPGFYIEHGFSTIIYARKIGENFRVNQNVTIGTNHGGNPVIKDNVSIYTGAIVLGSIVVSNNVKIGAGAVVISDIPENATVVPAKSRIILK